MGVQRYTMKWGAGDPPTNYREKFGSPGGESFGRDSCSVQRLYYTEWNTRGKATADFLGSCVPFRVGDYNYPSRNVPHYHPEFISSPSALPIDDVPYLHATSVQHTPFLADKDNPRQLDITDSMGGSPSNFLESQMSVTYNSLLHYIITDEQLATVNDSWKEVEVAAQNESTLMRYVAGKRIASPKYQTIPRQDSIAFSFDTSLVTNDAVIVLSESEIVIKWFDVHPDCYDAAAVDALCGKTNDDFFGHPLWPLGTFNPRTLVFLAPDVEMFRRATGEIYLDITYRFRYYPNGANYFYRNDSVPGFTPGSPSLFSDPGEEYNGPGYYFAARKQTGASSVAWPETDPLYDSFPNLLIYPPGDYTNFFRKKVA